MGKENSLKRERIWPLWKRIMKKSEWILLKEKKMKEKNTKEDEKHLHNTDVVFPSFIFVKLTFYDHKLGTKSDFPCPLNLFQQQCSPFLNNLFHLKSHSSKHFWNS